MSKLKEIVEMIRGFKKHKYWDDSPKVIAHKLYSRHLKEQGQEKPTAKEQYDFYRGWAYCCDYLLSVIDGTVNIKFPKANPTNKGDKE